MRPAEPLLHPVPLQCPMSTPPALPHCPALTGVHCRPAARTRHPCCRAGRHGRVISLVSGGERHVVHKLTQRLGVPVTELDVAFGDVEEKDPAEAEAEGQAAPRAPAAAQQQRPAQRQQQEQRRPAAGGERPRQQPAAGESAARRAKPWKNKK